MELRLDLLEFVTAEDFMGSALANSHRYKAEPLFSKTGVGYLAPATPEDRAREEAMSEAFIARIKQRQQEVEARKNSADPSTQS